MPVGIGQLTFHQEGWSQEITGLGGGGGMGQPCKQVNKMGTGVIYITRRMPKTQHTNLFKLFVILFLRSESEDHYST